MADATLSGITGDMPQASTEPDPTFLNEASQCRTVVGNTDGAQRSDASAPPVLESTLPIHLSDQSAPLAKETRLPIEP